jgi:DNA-binding IclR family transcriptional regulator
VPPRLAVKTSGGPDAARGSESARRALAILMTFSAESHTLSARDIAAATDIPVPSVYRYVAFLRDAGLLVGDGAGAYHLSARLISLARAAEAAETLTDIADPVMRRLAAETGETVILVRLVARSAVCVHRVETTHRLRTSFEPGQPLPLEHGASARLLLASMAAETRREYLAPLAERDPEGTARFEEQIILAGQRGWTTSEQEIDEGVWAAAAAIRDSTGIIAALSVPSPLVRAPASMRDTLLRQVRAAAGDINAAPASAHR